MVPFSSVTAAHQKILATLICGCSPWLFTVVLHRGPEGPLMHCAVFSVWLQWCYWHNDWKKCFTILRITMNQLPPVEGVDFKLRSKSWFLSWRQFAAAALLGLGFLIVSFTPGRGEDALLSIVGMLLACSVCCAGVILGIWSLESNYTKGVVRYAETRVDDVEMFFGVTFLSGEELERYRRGATPVAEALARTAERGWMSAPVLFRYRDETISLTDGDVKFGLIRSRGNQWVLYEMVNAREVRVKPFEY